MDFKDKRVVLTGASSGIGESLLVLLIAEGAKIVAASRTMTETKIKNRNLYKIDVDVTDQSQIDLLFDYACDKLGKIDIFIANAGFAYFEDYSGDFNHVDKIFKTNVYSALYSCKKMKDLYPKEEYNIVITASAVSFLSLPGYALYSGSKAAIRGFADAYRYELNKNQRLQLVYPVATKTKFFEIAGSPYMPWPRQSPEAVANEILRGIRKNKKNIYPSKLFIVGKYILPFALKMYQKLEGMKFRSIKKRGERSGDN
jgi:short-subunit dehydrogenase